MFSLITSFHSPLITRVHGEGARPWWQQRNPLHQRLPLPYFPYGRHLGLPTSWGIDGVKSSGFEPTLLAKAEHKMAPVRACNLP